MPRDIASSRHLNDFYSNVKRPLCVVFLVVKTQESKLWHAKCCLRLWFRTKSTLLSKLNAEGMPKLIFTFLMALYRYLHLPKSWTKIFWVLNSIQRREMCLRNSYSEHATRFEIEEIFHVCHPNALHDEYLIEQRLVHYICTTHK